MQIDENIRTAAIAMVRAARIENCEQVPGTPGIYVAPAPEATIQVMAAFREGDIEYVIGPLRT